jgi:DNA-binding transcriptional ArsR family regulator
LDSLLCKSFNDNYTIHWERLRSGVSDGKEEIYSIMFSSLKHPVRRKILRILADKPLAFSEMLELLGISSSNLTYHLDSLGELLSKDEKGVYRLSTFGQASVSTMKIVEEVPEVQSKKRTSLTKKWRLVTGVLLIGLIVFASLATLEVTTLNSALSERDTLQSKYNQLLSWTSTTDNAIDFLQNVVQLDTTKYQATLLSRDLETKKDLGGITEEVMRYSLKGTDDAGTASTLAVSFRFRNGMFSRYQLTVEEGAPIYAEAQSPFVFDAAKNIVDRLRGYENTDYLTNMSRLMSKVDTSKNIEIKEGNIKLNATVSGANAEVLMEYTENDVDFSPKSLGLVFENSILKQLTDGWGLFTIGSTAASVSNERAVTLARSALSSYKWAYNGVVISSFAYNPEPASVVFHPMTKNDLALYPQWTVTFYLDKVYAGNVYMISVAIWADTGEVAQIQPQNSLPTFSN